MNLEGRPASERERYARPVPRVLRPPVRSGPLAWGRRCAIAVALISHFKDVALANFREAESAVIRVVITVWRHDALETLVGEQVA